MGLNDIVCDEVRSKLDAAGREDIGLLIGATRTVLRSRQSLDKCSLVSHMVKRDHSNLIDLREDLKSVHRKLENIELSDSFIMMQSMADKARTESKWTGRLANLNSEVEIKTGRNIEDMKKQYRINEDNIKNFKMNL